MKKGLQKDLQHRTNAFKEKIQTKCNCPSKVFKHPSRPFSTSLPVRPNVNTTKRPSTTSMFKTGANRYNLFVPGKSHSSRVFADSSSSCGISQKWNFVHFKTVRWFGFLKVLVFYRVCVSGKWTNSKLDNNGDGAFELVVGCCHIGIRGLFLRTPTGLPKRSLN